MKVGDKVKTNDGKVGTIRSIEETPNRRYDIYFLVLPEYEGEGYYPGYLAWQLTVVPETPTHRWICGMCGEPWGWGHRVACAGPRYIRADSGLLQRIGYAPGFEGPIEEPIEDWFLVRCPQDGGKWYIPFTIGDTQMTKMATGKAMDWLKTNNDFGRVKEYRAFKWSDGVR